MLHNISLSTILAMITAEQITGIIDGIIADSKFYLVDLKVSTSKIKQKITVLVDTDEGILIDECSTISRQLGELLDEEIDNAYTLEVSSPGIDHPLKLSRQFVKNIGRTLKVIKKDGTEVKGELVNASENVFTIQPDKKKKEKTKPEPVELGYDEIKEAVVQVSFK
ncbi:ribosome maturation factor RimP [Jiulongibacter sediminis]|uniref:ribosome maturation factor RimP n=1 Tax=Jiulongibacter sediminis TaxID=1605367 RepID=UPI0026EFEDD6|nr:ribosome maturation factor RimP [Jiulongibacter sediminis]